MNETTEDLVPNQDVVSRESFLAKWMAGVGVFLYSGPVWGTLGTVVGMIRAFDTMDLAGGSDPGILAGDIHFALWTTVAGIVMGIGGVVLILIAFHGLKFRATWFYRWVLALSWVWCFLLFPLGLIFGMSNGILFYTRRGEFGKTAPLENRGQPAAG